MSMYATRVLLFLFIVSSCWCCNARDLTARPVTEGSDIFTVLQSHDNPLEVETQRVDEAGKNELCKLCEEFAGEALNYLNQNKAQTEILDILHNSCSKILPFKQQCTVLVDYYGPLFFLEVSTIKADEVCRKADLCEEGVPLFRRLSQNKCEICQNAVTEALLKLKDPDSELEIVQLLFKVCDSIGKSVKKCKRLVLEYSPIILINAEEFLEKNDVCSILRACDTTTGGGDLPVEKDSSMHASS